MIPFVGDIGLRVNTVSVLSSAFSVLFLYLMTVRLIKFWKKDINTTSDALMVHGASAIGALTFAFTETFWFNAVETEVYAMATLLMAVMFWLGLKWEQDMNTPRGKKWLVLISFIVGLSFGVHEALFLF